MATYTNTIFIKSTKFKNAGELAEAMDVKSFSNAFDIKISAENTDYNCSLGEDGLSIGFWEDFIILTGSRITSLIYDSVYQGHSEHLEKIHRLFPELNALLTFSNDTEMSFILVLIKGGTTIRKKQVFKEELQVTHDVGELLPNEFDYYSKLGNSKTNELKSLKEYRNGYNDINIQLSVIEDFCGGIPDFDNLKMNVGIEKYFGTGVIDALNETLGKEDEKLEKIVSCINDGLKSLKLKLRKYKQFPKLSGQGSGHQPGCVLVQNSNLQIVFRPLIRCSYEVSVEIILEIQFLNSSEGDSTPKEFKFKCFLANHVTVKNDFDALLKNLMEEINDFWIPVLKCADKGIYAIILDHCYTERYFALIISEAEKNKNKINRQIPYMHKFEDLVKLLQLKTFLEIDGKQEVSGLFATYLMQYKPIVNNITNSTYDSTRKQFEKYVSNFSC